MPKYTWTFTYNATSITSKVLSFNLQFGRQQYLDQYPAGQIILTIDNANNYAGTFQYGGEIEANIDGSPLATYTIESIVYEDYPGGTGLNTATIVATDALGRAGRAYADAYSLTQTFTGDQLEQFNSPTGPLPANVDIDSTGVTDSTAAATTYTGSILNYINLAQTTERGYIWVSGSKIYFLGRKYVSTGSMLTVGLGRTTSTTQIAYQDFQRIEAGQQYINTATIQPGAVAAQTAVNTTSKTTYGPASYSSATVDYNTTQALGNAQWIVNTFGDPNVLRFEVGFQDVAQNATALTDFRNIFTGFNKKVNLSYTVPGGSSTTVAAFMEGGSFSGTPASTYVRLNLSPLTYYQFFTLNSTSLGILDTSRLGW